MPRADHHYLQMDDGTIQVKLQDTPYCRCCLRHFKLMILQLPLSNKTSKMQKFLYAKRERANGHVIDAVAIKETRPEQDD